MKPRFKSIHALPLFRKAYTLLLFLGDPRPYRFFNTAAASFRYGSSIW